MGLEIGAALLLGTTAASIYSQQKAAKEQRKVYEAQQRRATVENVRSVRQQIREARIREASMLNQAAQSGGIGSSGLAGGVSSVYSQTGSNLGYMQDIARENTAIGNAQIKSAQYQSNAAVFGTIGNLAGTIFQGYTGTSVGGYIGQQMKKNGG